MKTAIITGIAGQDGAYLAQLLLAKGYRIVGFTRSISHGAFSKLEYLGIREQVEIVECDLLDIANILNWFRRFGPDEVYNLAAQSSVGLSFAQPIGTIQFNIVSVLNLLEAIKITGGNIRFYQASSSEMYGKVKKPPVTEETPMYPLSPYAVSKASAHWICVNYRESYGVPVCCGILFNHESFLRSEKFFIKKVLRESLRIQRGIQDKLFVGNIDIRRDFGYSPKYVEAMYLMMQEKIPDDYLICSGKSFSLREIIIYVFNYLGIPETCLEVDRTLYRPTEIEDIYGSNKKASEKLGWKYNLDFYQVLDILIEEEKKNAVLQL